MYIYIAINYIFLPLQGMSIFPLLVHFVLHVILKLILLEDLIKKSLCVACTLTLHRGGYSFLSILHFNSSSLPLL